MFLKHITYCQRKAFYEDDNEKINEIMLLNAIMLLISTKSERDTAIGLGSRDPPQDLEILP